MDDEQRAELLERDRPRRPRRALALAACLVLVAALVALAVDHRVRGREEAALEECSARVELSVRQAYGPLVAMTEYVRPALANGPTGTLRRGLFALLSRAAQGADGDLVATRTACAGVHVVPVHPALRERRDRCLRRVDRTATFLRAVARDGQAVTGRWPLGPAGC